VRAAQIFVFHGRAGAITEKKGGAYAFTQTAQASHVTSRATCHSTATTNLPGYSSQVTTTGAGLSARDST
jgi:hypothetical protein